MQKTRSLTLAAIVAALALVCLYAACLIPGGSLGLTALAGLMLAAVILKSGLKWGALTWAAVSLLAVVLLPNKAVAVLYALVLGHYPIWKSLTERLKRRPAELAAKLIIFNALLAVFYLAFRALFTQLTQGLPLPLALLWLAANGVFLVYDFACSRLLAAYIRRVERHV